MKLGAVLYEQKIYDRAIEAFQRALPSSPGTCAPASISPRPTWTPAARARRSRR